MFETRMRRVAFRLLPALLMAGAGVPGPLAAPLAAQVPADEQEEEVPAEQEAPIEWNFRPEPVASTATDASLQERWAAPFAVISQGRPAPRAPREVVVLRDSVAARRVAVAQAASGQSVAEVTLEEDAGPGAGSAAEADSVPGADTEGESEEDGSAGPEGEDEGEEDGPGATAEAARDQAGGEGESESGSESDAVSRVAEPSAPPAAARRASATARGARTHRVAYGETWYGLAREYRISSRDLAAANPDVDPERLQAGTVLRIPVAGSAGQAARTHTVSRGDTLFGIARRYGVSADAIRSANRLRDDVVRLGQTLVIPREEASR